MNNIYTNIELEKLFGRRPAGGTTLFEPVELGWLCPIDETHETAWSEFNDHIWCHDCLMDYFTLLCPKKYIPGHPYMNQLVVEEGIYQMQSLMKEWTLKKYRDEAHKNST